MVVFFFNLDIVCISLAYSVLHCLNFFLVSFLELTSCSLSSYYDSKIRGSCFFMNPAYMKVKFGVICCVISVVGAKGLGVIFKINVGIIILFELRNG